jgi:hypothetical protein
MDKSTEERIPITHHNLGVKIWVVLRANAAVIQVEYGGRVYETAMQDQGPVGFDEVKNG